MSDAEPKTPEIRIEPEPTPDELVAILIAMRPTTIDHVEEPPVSRWAQAARREQLRSPWDDVDRGWNR